MERTVGREQLLRLQRSESHTTLEKSQNKQRWLLFCNDVHSFEDRSIYSESDEDSIKDTDRFLLGFTPSSRTFSAERMRLPLPVFSLLKAS